MNDAVDAVIVGAGPYGLSIAAHLRAHGLGLRQFGRTMDGWISAMPRGMFLKSEGFASNLSDPQGKYTLAAFCEIAGEPYQRVGLPVSLARFVAYGQWFQEHQAPDVEDAMVTSVAPTDDGYLVDTSTGETIRTRNVVIATGVRQFAYVPEPLAALPAELSSHSSHHSDLSHFANRDVAVVGAGQSALETATLLHEQGAHVHLVARTHRLIWNNTPQLERSLVARARRPEAGLGNGWRTWFYSTKPAMFRRLSPARRIHIARTALGPAGAWWLRPRMDARFPVLLGHAVVGSETVGDRVRLRLRAENGDLRDLVTDHVIAATGYPPSVDRLTLLDERLRRGLRLVGGAPSVGSDFQATAPGLFLVGAAVASSFGPVMRFVYGADFAARVVTRQLVQRQGASRSRPRPRPVSRRS